MLEGKTAVITGSTSGIGLAIARALAYQTCNIMLNGFGDPAEIERMRRGIESEFDIQCQYHGADMSKPDEIRDLIETTDRHFGGVEILVNNAGIQHTSPIDSFDDAKWDSILAVNLSAAFHGTKAALPLMRRRGWGRIINTASVHGLVASVDKAAYVAAKHGLIGLTRVTALETAQENITCNAFCPGWVDTPLVQAQMQARAEALGVGFEEGKSSLLGEKQPSRDFVQPDHIAQLVMFLCTDAAAQITGVAIPIDGGWTAQ